MKLLSNGYTLIELMVVTCLCILFVYLASMQLSFFDSIIARTEIDKLCTICRYLHQCAIATNTEHVLIFNSEKNEYSFKNYHEKLPQYVTFGVLENTKGPPSQPQNILKNPITFPSHQIHFYPTGIISSGTVYLIDTSKQHMYALSNAVSHVSYLRLYRYDGTWKLV